MPRARMSVLRAPAGNHQEVGWFFMMLRVALMLSNVGWGRSKV